MNYFRCNGSTECPLGDDERGCEACLDFQFKCSSGRCIPVEWSCDGTNDCDDDSDEDPLLCHSRKEQSGM